MRSNVRKFFFLLPPPLHHRSFNDKRWIGYDCPQSDNMEVGVIVIDESLIGALGFKKIRTSHLTFL